ncbi:putative dinucleotide-binding enzyme [Arthrobacter sp. 1088]|uniref:NADPH-dependent F420 reductase n=1 Tax=unclassified Arthrobacter TaxID=235627 RepID=UPI001CC448A0|nr:MULTISPECIES: NAD(P)-binding domain-containing protein [unclassified Arthrobacter]MDR6687016.1 putative dinucleotide-binding enzyme [Arthrobacter sp. 1088]BCW49094.1 oxidoreductase [Arthrobacter sp. StoSoilB13]
MKIAVLGTGMVGHALAGKLVSLGHEVIMGSRESGNPKGEEWARQAGPRARAGSFAEACAESELIVNATPGTVSLAVLAEAGDTTLNGKILLDVANALDGSGGFPPSLTVCNTDSIAETIQRTYPGVRVVKSLNTVSAPVMVDPGRLPGPHDMFMAGNDADAKSTVSGLLQEFGWAPEHIRDLGGLDAARGMEMWLPLWLRIFMQQPKGKMFNIAIVSE